MEGEGKDGKEAMSCGGKENNGCQCGRDGVNGWVRVGEIEDRRRVYLRKDRKGMVWYGLGEIR